MAQALLERNDLTGREVVEMIQAAANGSEKVDSELLLKGLVEETIVSGNNGTSKDKPKAKRQTEPKVDVAEI